MMTKTLKIILILVIGSLVSLGSLSNGASAEKYSSMVDIVIECQDLYEQFVLLGETQFRTVHNYDALSQKCSLLFHDSLWDSSDNNRVSILADRLSEISIKKTADNSENLDFFIRDIATISTDTQNEYQYSFEVCGGEHYLEISAIGIQSDIKNITLKPNYFLSPEACIGYDVLIEANNPETIIVSGYVIRETQGIEELRSEIESLKQELENKMKIFEKQIQSMIDLVKII